jgi:hypothetical protein
MRLLPGTLLSVWGRAAAVVRCTVTTIVVLVGTATILGLLDQLAWVLWTWPSFAIGSRKANDGPVAVARRGRA